MATVRIKNRLETDIRDLVVKLEDNGETLVLNMITAEQKHKTIKTKVSGYGVRIESHGEISEYTGKGSTVVIGNIDEAQTWGCIRNQGVISKSNRKVDLDSGINAMKYYKGALGFELLASKLHKMHIIHVDGTLNMLDNSQGLLALLEGTIDKVCEHGDLYTKGVILNANSINLIYSTKCIGE